MVEDKYQKLCHTFFESYISLERNKNTKGQVPAALLFTFLNRITFRNKLYCGRIRIKDFITHVLILAAIGNRKDKDADSPIEKIFRKRQHSSQKSSVTTS